MGMFDNVKSEIPLPDGWGQEVLQSKDFNCFMDTYTIRKDGRLIREEEHGAVDLNFHGIFNFYGLETIGYEEPKPDDVFRRPITVWHEYNAKFTDGRLVEILQVDDGERRG